MRRINADAPSRKPLRPVLPREATPGVRLRLVSDTTPGKHERRRFDCTRLATCEEEWSHAHGNAQAKCPAVCIRYEREGRREIESIGGGGIVMGGGQ